MLEGTERGRGFSVLHSRLGPRPASFPVLFAAPGVRTGDLETRDPPL